MQRWPIDVSKRKCSTNDQKQSVEEIDSNLEQRWAQIEKVRREKRIVEDQNVVEELIAKSTRCSSLTC